MQKVYLVYEFTSIPDSVWDNEEHTNARAKELDASNGDEFASVVPFQLNQPEGMCG